MITSQNERVSCSAPHHFHAAAISLYMGGFGIVQTPAGHDAPEISVQLEVSDAPVAAHRAKHVFEMRARLGMGSVQRVPRALSPSSKRHAIGRQRNALAVLHEPI